MNERLPLPQATRRRPVIGQALHDALIDDRDGPLPAMLLALTALAGVVDAVSILALNHVFVAAMTGNLVFIGLGIAGASGFSVGAPALALSVFVVGALIGAQFADARARTADGPCETSRCSRPSSRCP